MATGHGNIASCAHRLGPQLGWVTVSSPALPESQMTSDLTRGHLACSEPCKPALASYIKEIWLPVASSPQLPPPPLDRNMRPNFPRHAAGEFWLLSCAATSCLCHSSQGKFNQYSWHKAGAVPHPCSRLSCHCFGHLHPILEHQVQLPAHRPETLPKDEPTTWAPTTHVGVPKIEFLLLALVWPSLAHCSHLEIESLDGSSLCFSLFVTVFHINIFILLKKYS